MKEIYTIGHSNFPIEHLIKRIKKYEINCVIDVRSNPSSKYTPQYNSRELKSSLEKLEIQYLFMGKEFGARQTNEELFNVEGYLDFERFSETDIFKRGIERIENGIKKGYLIALMCTERDPIDCHRSILVAKKLKEYNFNVKNILGDGSIELQTELEERLLDMYYPNRLQQDFFSLLAAWRKNDELIENAYKLRNHEIGYRKK